jgi:hypothetical protein
MQRRALSAAKFAGKWRVMCTESGRSWTIAYDDEHFKIFYTNEPFHCFYLNADFYVPPYLKNNAAVHEKVTPTTKWP